MAGFKKSTKEKAADARPSFWQQLLGTVAQTIPQAAASIGKSYLEDKWSTANQIEAKKEIADHQAKLDEAARENKDRARMTQYQQQLQLERDKAGVASVADALRRLGMPGVAADVQYQGREWAPRQKAIPGFVGPMQPPSTDPEQFGARVSDYFQQLPPELKRRLWETSGERVSRIQAEAGRARDAMRIAEGVANRANKLHRKYLDIDFKRNKLSVDQLSDLDKSISKLEVDIARLEDMPLERKLISGTGHLESSKERLGELKAMRQRMSREPTSRGGARPAPKKQQSVGARNQKELTRILQEASGGRYKNWKTAPEAVRKQVIDFYDREVAKK